MSARTPSQTEVLLEQAEQILTGVTSSGSANPNRIACWVARRALELLIIELLVRRSINTGAANMRSLLICLSVTYQDEPGLVLAAQSGWDQLSGACHQHAYELAPTHAEVDRMLDAVRTLGEFVESGDPIDQSAR